MFKQIIKRMFVLGGIVILLILVAGGAYWIIRKNQTSKPIPVVSIHSPLSGTEIGLDDTLIIHSTSWDQGAYLSGVELWVSRNGTLSLLDRSTPITKSHTFSLSQGWQPTSSGSYRFIVRAFNQQGSAGQASVDIQVVEKPGDEMVIMEDQIMPPPSGEVESLQSALLGDESRAGAEEAESSEGAEGSEGAEAPEAAEEEPQGAIPPPPNPDPVQPLPPDFLVGMFDLVLDAFIPIDFNDVLVEVEALSLTVEQEYAQLYCYVGLGNNPAERVPDAGSFMVSNTYEWNLADYLGGCNKASLVIPQDQDLTVYLECFGLNKSSNYPIPLGFYKHSHPSADWNGQIFEGVSEDGEGFVVTYRINQAAGPLVAPINLQESGWGGTTYLQWLWEGNQNDIDGFKIYRNENLIATVNPEYSLLEIPSWWTVPPCQEEYTYKVTAYQDELESAPSNDLNYQGDLCGDENDIIDLQTQSICDNAGRRFDVTYHYQSPHGLANVEIRAFENGDLIDAIQSTRPQIQYGDGTVQVALMNHSDEYYVTDQIMVTLSDQNGQPFYVETFDQFESWVPVMPDLTISDAWVDWELNKVHVQIENIACAGPPTSPPLVSLIPETDDRILEKNATSEIPARTYKMVHFDLPLDEIGPNENIWTGEIRVLVDRWDSIEESENENNEFTISPAVSSSIYWEGLQFTEIEVFDDHDRYSDGEWDLNVKIGRFHNGNIESATEYGGTYDTYGHRYNWGEGVHSLNITFSPYLEQNDALVFKVFGYEREFYRIPEYGGDYLGKAYVYHSPDGVEIPVLEDHGYIHMGSWKNGGTFAVWSDKYDYKITYQIIIND